MDKLHFSEDIAGEEPTEAALSAGGFAPHEFDLAVLEEVQGVGRSALLENFLPGRILLAAEGLAYA
jgi:uncharacterized protein involved in copper resistance